MLAIAGGIIIAVLVLAYLDVVLALIAYGIAFVVLAVLGIGAIWVLVLIYEAADVPPSSVAGGIRVSG